MCISNIAPRRDPQQRRARLFVVYTRTRRHCALWQEVQAVGLSVLVSCVCAGPWLPLVPLKDVPPKCSQTGHSHKLEPSETMTNVHSSHLAWYYHCWLGIKLTFGNALHVETLLQARVKWIGFQTLPTVLDHILIGPLMKLLNKLAKCPS